MNDNSFLEMPPVFCCIVKLIIMYVIIGYVITLCIYIYLGYVFLCFKLYLPE